jgi:hypothetical protein
MSPLNGVRVVARGLQKGLAAIRSGLETKWSSCQVEGQNNRLETLKRDMYGRASATCWIDVNATEVGRRSNCVSGLSQLPRRADVVVAGSRRHALALREPFTKSLPRVNHTSGTPSFVRDWRPRR